MTIRIRTTESVVLIDRPNGRYTRGYSLQYGYGRARKTAHKAATKKR
jgi:hypothetical protein